MISNDKTTGLPPESSHQSGDDQCTDEPDGVVNAIIDRINCGETEAVPLLIAAELKYINVNAQKVGKTQFPFLQNQSWLTSAANSIYTNLLEDLTSYALTRCGHETLASSSINDKMSGNTRRKKLVVILLGRQAFRRIIDSAIDRHFDRVRKDKQRTNVRFGGSARTVPPLSTIPDDSNEKTLQDFEDRIASLKSDWREVLRLHFVDDLTQVAIANRLGVSQKTIHDRLRDALTELRKQSQDPNDHPT